jgi:hypothetical protein
VRSLNITATNAFMGLCTAPPPPAASAQAIAATAGYTQNTFHSASFSTDNVDVDDTQAAGFQWYVHSPNYGATSPSEFTFNADGSLSISSGAIYSVGSSNFGQYSGQAFGGGAYFEATISFNETATRTYDQSTGEFPAWWGEPIQHWIFTGNNGNAPGDTWLNNTIGTAADFTGSIDGTTGVLTVTAMTAGSPSNLTSGSHLLGADIPAGISLNTQGTIGTGGTGTYNTNYRGANIASEAMSTDTYDPWYVHYVETDFFEYNSRYHSAGQYWGATLDWAGDLGNGGYYVGAENTGLQQITMPAGTDTSQPHRYGYLWVPATPTTQGSITYYFDGQPTTDAFTYGFYDSNNPPGQPIDDTQPWKFGVLDSQQQVLILNTPVGTDQFRIYDVTVWQPLLDSASEGIDASADPSGSVQAIVTDHGLHETHHNLAAGQLANAAGHVWDFLM